jgi:hypothetical protein
MHMLIKFLPPTPSHLTSTEQTRAVQMEHHRALAPVPPRGCQPQLPGRLSQTECFWTQSQPPAAAAALEEGRARQLQPLADSAHHAAVRVHQQRLTEPRLAHHRHRHKRRLAQQEAVTDSRG